MRDEEMKGYFFAVIGLFFFISVICFLCHINRKKKKHYSLFSKLSDNKDPWIAYPSLLANLVYKKKSKLFPFLITLLVLLILLVIVIGFNKS